MDRFEDLSFRLNAQIEEAKTLEKLIRTCPNSFDLLQLSSRLLMILEEAEDLIISISSGSLDLHSRIFIRP